MNKNEILVLVQKVFERCNNDRDKTAEELMKLAEEDPKLMLYFLDHGVDMLRAIAEGQLETKH